MMMKKIWMILKRKRMMKIWMILTRKRIMNTIKKKNNRAKIEMITRKR
jgi:hypothetical protein